MPQGRSGQCVRPLILAEAVEAVVWSQFAELNKAVAEGVAPETRRAVIRPVLRKVRLGDDVYELWYEWHD